MLGVPIPEFRSSSGYSLIVGQEQIKQALELTYIAPRIGGVLIRGDRGTGKSTAVRAFAQMINGQLPVTLPINATDDRVVGGWNIDELMLHRRPVPQPGLLEQASATGMLYIDEVNLLDDHIVNLILDVASTGHLSVQYESQDEHKQLSFVLVGTMNPEEGLLRPQLLDRFGLIVDVEVCTERRKVRVQSGRTSGRLRLGAGRARRGRACGRGARRARTSGERRADGAPAPPRWNSGGRADRVDR